MTKKLLIVIMFTIVIVAALGGAFWYFLIRIPPTASVTISGNTPGQNGFVPLDRNTPSQPTGQNTGTTQNNASSTGTTGTANARVPVLRQLSATPVGGYGTVASTTTTIVRWVDRGRGNVYEALGNSAVITTLSNTLVPRIYESTWNNDLSTFIGQYLSDAGDTITTVITSIIKNPAAPASSSLGTTTAGTSAVPVSGTPFQLKGKVISGNVIAVAASPKKDRVLVVTNENGRAVGYTSKFDGTAQAQLFDLPMTQIRVDWPEDNTVAVSTKAGASYPGYLYLINTKTGVSREILSGIPGLIAKVSKDASQVFYSRTGTGNDAVTDALLNVKTGATTPVIIHVLADACVWSSKFTTDIYCGAPTNIPDGVYPDDWYSGKSSFIDGIWLFDTSTNRLHQIANLLSQGNVQIDAYNLQLASNDDFLYFMNKNDLSLWSLDLVATN